MAVRLAAGHRREEGNLAGASNHRIWLNMGVVDRGAITRPLEGVGVARRASPATPSSSTVRTPSAAGSTISSALPTLAHPGEILHLHASSSDEVMNPGAE
jgi:hypothetical protein